MRVPARIYPGTGSQLDLGLEDGARNAEWHSILSLVAQAAQIPSVSGINNHQFCFRDHGDPEHHAVMPDQSWDNLRPHSHPRAHMSQAIDFERFLADQKAYMLKFGNLSERKEQWLDKIDALFHQVRILLEPYSSSGSIDFVLSTCETHEEEIGSYRVRRLAINLGASCVQFVPVGTMLLGSAGRVDLLGPRGCVRFSLVRPGLDRPMHVSHEALGSTSGGSRCGQLDITPYEWKISTSPPGIRYLNIDATSLQSAIMHAATGQFRHRQS